MSKVKTRAAEAERAARVPQGPRVPGKRREKQDKPTEEPALTHFTS